MERGREVVAMAHRTARTRHAYTLLEVILALTLFGIIMSAMALAVSAGLRAFAASNIRQQETMDIRGVFRFLNQDLQATFASGANPASLFVGNGGSGGGGNTGLLTFTTLGNRIVGMESTDASALLTGVTANSQSGMNVPQSDVALVRYEFDRQNGTLSRIVVPVPNTMLVGQKSPEPETQIAQHIESINLRFWDASNRQWRQNWDYQQKSQQQSQNQQGSTGSQGSGGNNGNNQSTGDNTPPTAVEVTVTMRRGDGMLSNLMTTIPVLAPQPVSNTVAIPGGQAGSPQNNQGSGSPSDGSPSGGNPSGGNPSGNGQGTP